MYIYNVSILSFFQSEVKLIPKRKGTLVLSAFFSTSKKLLFHYAPQFNEIQHLCTEIQKIWCLAAPPSSKTTIIKTRNEGKSFGRMAKRAFALRDFQTRGESTPGCTEAVSVPRVGQAP